MFAWLFLSTATVGVAAEEYGNAKIRNRRLASAWIHCAGSATYEVTEP